MKFVSFAFFLLALHLSMAIINGMGIFAVTRNPDSDVLNAVTSDTIADSSYTQSQATQQQNFGFGDFIKSLFFFVTGFATTVLALPYTLWVLGVPGWLATLLSLPVYAMYLYALAQWIGNRSESGMR